MPHLEISQGNHCIAASTISYKWRGKCIKGENNSSIQCVHNNAKVTATHIINEALKVKLEQQQNNNARTKFEEEDLICDEDTAMNDIPILSSFEIESINKKNDMEYLSNLTTESFAGVEV